VISLAKLIDTIKNALSVFRVSKETLLHIISLLGIFLIAFIARLYPVIAAGYSLRAYDTFVQYLSTILVEKHGLSYLLTKVDFNTWYPYGRSWTALYIGIPLFAALIHQFLLSIGVNVELIVVATLIPPFFGSLAVLVVYAIANELKGRRAALFASFLAAISPGMIQRTIAGFFDNESIGIFLVLLTLWLFIVASKKGSVTIALIGGLSLGLLGWTWGVYRYLYGLLALYVVTLILIRKLDSNVAIAYSVMVGLGLGMTAILPRNYGIILSFEGIMAWGTLALVLIDEFASYFSQVLAGGRREAYLKLLVGSSIVIAVGVVYLYVTNQLAPLGAKFASVINPALRTALPTFSSVSENQPAAWGVIFMGIFMSTLFAPISIYYAMERRNFIQVLLVLMILTGFYFSASISRYLVIGAPLLAIGAGIGIDYVLDPFARALRGEWIVHRIKPVRARLGEARLPRGEAVVAYMIVALLLSLSIYNGVQVVRVWGGYDIDETELKIFHYLRTHASLEDVVLSWWDYGYRLRVFGNVTVLADNGTTNSTQMGVVGAMLMLPENKSIELMRKYNVKYVVVYGVDLYKAIWMIKIANKHAPNLNVTESAYFNSKEGRYKEPFFYSVLWSLIVYRESSDQVSNWVSQLGEESIKNKATSFIPSTLAYFELLVSAVSRTSLVKLYKVVYRSDLIPPESPTQNSTTLSTTGTVNSYSASEGYFIHQIDTSLQYPEETIETHELYTILLKLENHKFYSILFL